MFKAKTRTRKVRHSSRSRRPGTRTTRSPAVGKILLLAMMPLTLALGGGLAVKNMLARVEPIAGTRCYPQEDQIQYAMLIDFSMTADNSHTQQQDLQTAMLNIYNDLPVNGKLSIFTTARNAKGGDIAVADFSVCKPPETQEEQTLLAGYADSRQVLAKQAEEGRGEYREHVQHILADSQDATKTALYSPILESIQSVSRYYQRTHLDVFTLYSDGIQSSELLQFCKTQGHLPPFAQFTKLGEYQVIKPEDFNGTHVNILLLESIQLPSPLLPYCSNAELRSFYPAYFEGHGATTQLTRIRYGAAS